MKNIKNQLIGLLKDLKEELKNPHREYQNYEYFEIKVKIEIVTDILELFEDESDKQEIFDKLKFTKLQIN